MGANELYLSYARVIEMCKGTLLEKTPWKCVRWRYKTDSKVLWVNSRNGNPVFDKLVDNNIIVQFAVAILKDDQTGKDQPVWLGETVYRKNDTESAVTVSRCHGSSLLFKSIENGKKEYYFSWDVNKHFTFHSTPPKPKRTFTLNGVELPCPVNNLDVYEIFISVRDGVSDRCTNRFSFQTELDARKVFDAVAETLESAERNA